jgi:hypothetical protein
LGVSLLHGQLNAYSDGVECVCALFPANILLSQNNNISLRGLRKSARRCACALMGVHDDALYKDIDHILNSEHECALLRLPRTMASMVIFPYAGWMCCWCCWCWSCWLLVLLVICLWC